MSSSTGHIFRAEKPGFKNLVIKKNLSYNLKDFFWGMSAVRVKKLKLLLIKQYSRFFRRVRENHIGAGSFDTG